ncbi:MAG TPA: cysteine desulfurase family protein [Stellaceae bacterium]|nr:cysteine desulfurase family protein [Stellaceae bacterium]
MPISAYLDHNATAPVRPEVIDALVAALADGGNPSSVHGAGRRARRAVEQARVTLAAALGADPAAIVFTSGATEANHLALAGTGRRRVLVSAIEHPSVRDALPDAGVIPVTADGSVDLAALERLLGDGGDDSLVAVMAANNETGVIQPIAEVVDLAHRYGALVLCDAVQAFGKIPVDVRALGADLVSVSAHKIGGPQGIGALVVRAGTPLTAPAAGGGQERGLRPGTENVAGIVGFGVAARLAIAELDQFAALAELRDAAERRLLAVDPAARVFGGTVSRLANTSCIAMPGVRAETQVMALDLAGIAVSAGSACSSGKVRRSRVLDAMAVPPDLAESAIRISLGRATLPSDIDRLVDAWSMLRWRTQPIAKPAA